MPAYLLPWLTAAAALVPLIYLERWIHKHLQGVGLLLTNDPEVAVLFYYVLLLPGVLLHEGSHWLAAKLLRVRIRRVSLWPERGRGGMIRLGLVETAQADPLRATLIGLAPLAAGVAAITLIGTLLDTSAVAAALTTGDLPTIWAALRNLSATPDFWLWLYLLFAVSNAMLPSASDRRNWLIVGGAIVAIALVMFLLDLGSLVQAGIEGPLAQIARWLSLAFISAALIDVFFAALIALLEAILGRVVGREIEYK
jgi:hypothetical protein